MASVARTRFLTFLWVSLLLRVDAWANPEHVRSATSQVGRSTANSQSAPSFRRKRVRSATGALFTKPHRKELESWGMDPTAFRNLWCEPSRTERGTPEKIQTCWSDVVMDRDGKPIEMDFATAEKFCASQNGRLPSGWTPEENASHEGMNSDFVRLRELLGAKRGQPSGYFPHLLPHLKKQKKQNRTIEWMFWASSSPADNLKAKHFFIAENGFIGSERSVERTAEQKAATFQVRCIFTRSE